MSQSRYVEKTLHSSNWIAELNTAPCTVYENAELTITLRLAFRQINPGPGLDEGTARDSTNVARRTIRWTSGEWTRWLREFKRSVEEYWSGKFWLINRFSMLDYKMKGAMYRPNIWCRFKLRIIDAPLGPVHAHHIIKVVCLHPQELEFKSHSKLYDNRDIRPNFKQLDSHGQPLMQRPHVHEIGHLLGNQHIDVGKPHCPTLGDTNAKQCYGITDWDKRNVMGTGMVLTPVLAHPWQRAMCAITGFGNPRSPEDWMPSLLRQCPRTLEEARIGQVITWPRFLA